MSNNLAEEKKTEATTAHVISGTESPQESFTLQIRNAFEKAIKILRNPTTIWKQIKAEDDSIRSIYLKYVLYMAAIPAICGFIGMTVIGISIPFAGTMRAGLFSGLIYHIGFYINSLVALFVGALIIEAIAPFFEGKTDRTSALKLLAYSSTAVYLAGFLSLIPMLGILGALLSIYSMYLYYEGIPIMTGIPATGKRIAFFFASIVGMIVASLIIWTVISQVTPYPFNDLSNSLNVDFSDMVSE